MGLGGFRVVKFFLGTFGYIVGGRDWKISSGLFMLKIVFRKCLLVQHSPVRASHMCSSIGDSVEFIENEWEILEQQVHLVDKSTVFRQMKTRLFEQFQQSWKNSLPYRETMIIQPNYGFSILEWSVFIEAEKMGHRHSTLTLFKQCFNSHNSFQRKNEFSWILKIYNNRLFKD